jgi:hypothetical protein
MQALALLVIPAVGALTSLATGIVAYISGRLRRRNTEAGPEERIKVLDLKNLRLTDAEHSGEFIEVTPEQLGQIAERSKHNAEPDAGVPRGGEGGYEKLGDAGLAARNRDMQQLKEREVETLRELQAHAPASEQATVADALARTETEAREYRERADHYERKLNEDS